MGRRSPDWMGGAGFEPTHPRVLPVTGRERGYQLAVASSRRGMLPDYINHPLVPPERFERPSPGPEPGGLDQTILRGWERPSPGFEPGTTESQSVMLPLHHEGQKKVADESY